MITKSVRRCPLGTLSIPSSSRKGSKQWRRLAFFTRRRFCLSVAPLFLNDSSTEISSAKYSFCNCFNITISARCKSSILTASLTGDTGVAFGTGGRHFSSQRLFRRQMKRRQLATALLARCQVEKRFRRSKLCWLHELESSSPVGRPVSHRSLTDHRTLELPPSKAFVALKAMAIYQ